MTRGPRERALNRGRRGEGTAVRHLSRRGWSILARNWRGAGGEIDIVAERDGTIAFVEVKTRSGEDGANERLTARQRDRIQRAAEAFLRSHPELAESEVRLDLMMVTHGRPWLPPRVAHLPNAWTG